MKRFKFITICFILPALAVCAVVFGSDYVKNTNMQLCKHQYALCTSAPCVPQPGDPSKAVCLCDVEEGPACPRFPVRRCNQARMLKASALSIPHSHSSNSKRAKSHEVPRRDSLDLVLEQALHCGSCKS